MIEVKAPNLVDVSSLMLFIAGTIDNGNSHNWQKDLISRLQLPDFVTAINPRRDDWDSSWAQDYSDPKFKQQVDWELDYICMSDIVFFFIGKDSKSPISLMELGIASAARNRVIVFCEDGFYRKGNVDALCARFDLTTVKSWDEAVDSILWNVQDIQSCEYW
jgi:hypothetical protein